MPKHKILVRSQDHVFYTVVTCKIKHLQKCFRAISPGYAVDVKML